MAMSRKFVVETVVAAMVAAGGRTSCEVSRDKPVTVATAGLDVRFDSRRKCDVSEKCLDWVGWQRRVKMLLGGRL